MANTSSLQMGTGGEEGMLVLLCGSVSVEMTSFWG